jgi:hypothetical protein
MGPQQIVHPQAQLRILSAGFFEVGAAILKRSSIERFVENGLGVGINIDYGWLP